MTEQLPLIGVMPRINTPGSESVGDGAPMLQILSVQDAVETPWTTDAHFATYRPSDESAEWPRCNKPLLSALRREGVDLTTQLLVLDYDLPGHRHWASAEEQERFLASLAELSEAFPLAWAWSAYYTTRGGARLVYVLDRPIPVDNAEGKHQWLCQQFVRHGVGIDLTVSDWTRVFRLPFVVRDGEGTWDAAIPPAYEAQWSNRIDPDRLGSAVRTKASAYAAATPLDRPRPDPEDAEALLRTVNASGYRAMTDWLKAAKRRLKGRECFGCLFEHQPIAAAGSRDATIHRYVGQATSLLAHVGGTTAEHVYALFLDPVQQLEPDAQTPDWTSVLWSAVCRLWAKEEAKIEERKRVAAERREEAIGLLDRIILGMKDWCDDPRLFDAETAVEFVAERLVCSVAGTQAHYILGGDGYYRNVPVTAGQLPAAIREAGLDRLVCLIDPDDEGKSIPPQTLKTKHETIVARVKGLPQIPGSRIVDMGTEQATLEVCLYRLNPRLDPEFSSDVDTWLRLFFGDGYPEAENWLAWATALGVPTCALSICGDPGIGKKMLAVGLSETLERPALGTAKDLTDKHQYGLLSTPFLCVNEGWPEGSVFQDPADSFRALVSGDPIHVEEKFRAPVEVHATPRVIITANNMEAISRLTARRDPSLADRDAILERILHFNCDSQAEHWLRSQGGLAFTSREGCRWIRGDGGEKSDFVIARHILWLAAHRRRAMSSGRFAVVGNGDQTLSYMMRTRSGVAPEVVEAVIKLVELNNPREAGVVVDHQEHLMATPSGVVEWLRKNRRPGQREVKTSQVSQAFRHLMVGEPPAGGLELPGYAHLGKKRWYRLDAVILAEAARQDGWACERLQKLAARQEQEMRHARDRKLMSNGHQNGHQA